MRNKQLIGTISTITGATLWGLNSVAGKYVMGTKGVDPVWMVTLRLISAGIVLLLMAVVMNRRSGLSGAGSGSGDSGSICAIWTHKWSVARLLVVAVFAFATCQATYFAAISFSNAGITTAIQQTSPCFVLLWMLFLERRLPKRMELLVLVMAVLGAFILATGGNIGALIIPVPALVCALISAITCAMYTLLPGKLIEKFGTFPVSGWGMLIGGIVMIPIAKLWIVSGVWDISTVAVFSFVVLFGTVAAFATYLYGVTIIGPVKGSIYGLMEPVVATVASAVILRQAFSVTDLLGIAIILGGVVIQSLKLKE